MLEWELIIVGAGPAGLTAGVYAGNRGLKTLILDSAEPGGLLAAMYSNKTIKNIPGFPDGISAGDFAGLLKEQAEKAGAEIRKERVIDISVEKKIKTEESEYISKAIILAVGASPKRLGIPGEDKFARIGLVVYNLSSPDEFSGKRTLIVGGGNTAIEAALALEKIAKVTLIHRRDEFRASEELVDKLKGSGVEVIYNTELKEIKGDKKINSVVLFNKLTKSFEKEIDAVLLTVGLVPNTEIFKKIGIKLTEEKYIMTDQAQRTNVEGIFAAGDVTGIFNQVCVACGQGAVAANSAYKYIKKPYWV
ncbi:MAG: FAD-dependent oxidoreductase [Euryarchaeota archaeon]|nr:FAD-dependent oxidoreductase [Euryarchaeota archaeon]